MAFSVHQPLRLFLLVATSSPSHLEAERQKLIGAVRYAPASTQNAKKPNSRSMVPKVDVLEGGVNVVYPSSYSIFSLYFLCMHPTTIYLVVLLRLCSMSSYDTRRNGEDVAR